MLSRTDYESYLKEIGDIESRMVTIYAKCADMTAKEKMNGIFIHLSDQERRHVLLYKKLASLILGSETSP